MYIETVPNRRSKPAVLLRESRREGSKVVKRTIANLTDWPEDKLRALKLVLKGEPQSLDHLEIDRSLPHGHVEALLSASRRLGLERLIAAKRSRQRNIVMALVIERLLSPASKLATVRSWSQTSLADQFGLENVTAEEVYEALDWLLERQPAIQAKLAARHLDEDSLVLYDLSSAYYEGSHCPLAEWGRYRDRPGKRVIAFGVITDEQGRPVAINVHPGKTSDPSTVIPQVKALQDQYGLERIVLVGDRGLLTHTQIRHLRDEAKLGWISALRHDSIRKLVGSGELQMSLFDETNLAEIQSDLYPGERLIVCFNPLLAEENRRRRNSMLEAIETQLKELQVRAPRRSRPAPIGTRVARVINREGVAKLFDITIGEHSFEWSRNKKAIQDEQQLDGIYVIRTSEPQNILSSEDVVRRYKSLSQVERAFRCIKGIDLMVRPIYLRTEPHVRAHIFLCMLAYYLEWHLRRAWSSLLFQDEELESDRITRDPVAPARPSDSVAEKKSSRRNSEGLPLHSFSTLLAEMGTLAKVTCRFGSQSSDATLTYTTKPTLIQQEALRLIEEYPYS